MKLRTIGSREVMSKDGYVVADIYLDDDAIRALIVKATGSKSFPPSAKHGPVHVSIRGYAIQKEMK